jgi:hypothetical protein
MKNHQFLVILSLENILNLVIANINFHRSQCLSLIVILRNISRAYKYKNEMDLSSREKLCSKILFTVPAKGSFTISDYKDINIELSYCNTF